MAKGNADGVNIQVLVRVRPMNKGEAGTQRVVTAKPSLRQVDLSIPVAGKRSTKTYTFDGVFDERASQAEVYQRAIAPIVKDVLKGFNCTIFAYGQTGTGKTYTMEGCQQASDYLHSADSAGIIPRAANAVFRHLEANYSEYSVRVSFLELYNEELNDLLGADLTSDASQDPKRKLRLQEGRHGVCVAGLEEVHVANTAELFALLERGINQRRVAETKLNKSSSRSHTIFTLNIAMKEQNDAGEEFVRIGKLNLVDLAGSENIKNSGAAGMAAREAGKINTSLLTLSRVITSLVEHAPHVPYRESKLTRLLQDSLGGTTKTALIANLTPSSAALDVTAATLDYANKAKSIRNRPEVNQTLTKKELMSQLTAQIQELKGELAAARDKNGVYLSVEKHSQMEAQIKAQNSAIGELETQIDAKLQELAEMKKLFGEKEVELQAAEAKHTAALDDVDQTASTVTARMQALRTGTDLFQQRRCAVSDEMNDMLDRFLAGSKAQAKAMRQQLAATAAALSTAGSSVAALSTEHEASTSAAVEQGSDAATAAGAKHAASVDEMLEVASAALDTMLEHVAEQEQGIIEWAEQHRQHLTESHAQVVDFLDQQTSLWTRTADDVAAAVVQQAQQAQEQRNALAAMARAQVAETEEVVQRVAAQMTALLTSEMQQMNETTRDATCAVDAGLETVANSADTMGKRVAGTAASARDLVQAQRRAAEETRAAALTSVLAQVADAGDEAAAVRSSVHSLQQMLTQRTQGLRQLVVDEAERSVSALSSLSARGTQFHQATARALAELAAAVEDGERALASKVDSAADQHAVDLTSVRRKHDESFDAGDDLAQLCGTTELHTRHAVTTLAQRLRGQPVDDLDAGALADDEGDLVAARRRHRRRSALRGSFVGTADSENNALCTPEKRRASMLDRAPLGEVTNSPMVTVRAD